MKHMLILTALLTTLILVPWYAPAAQEETVNVDIDIERIIEEAKEGDGKKIIIIRKEERTQNQKAPGPLGMNVTLKFTLEGAGQSFSVITATTAFMLAGHHTSTVSERVGYQDLDEGELEEEYEDEEFEDEEYEEELAETYVLNESTVNISGNIQLTDTGALLIRCAGSIMHESVVDEELEGAAERVANSSVLNFETSAMMRPGETKTLVTQGPLRLVLHIATDET